MRQGLDPAESQCEMHTRFTGAGLVEACTARPVMRGDACALVWPGSSSMRMPCERNTLAHPSHSTPGSAMSQLSACSASMCLDEDIAKPEHDAEQSAPPAPSPGTPQSAPRPPLWTQDPVWQEHVAALADFPKVVSVLELCAGTGAATVALQLLLGASKVRLSGAWDLDPDLQCVYDVVHPGASNIRLGERGDILKTELSEFPDANIMVAGPPCPPFSSCGSRKRFADQRARPFERCVEVLIELNARSSRPHAQPEPATTDGQPRDALMFFVLENVPGMAFQQQNAQTDLQAICTRLKRNLGSDWMVRPIELNAVHYGLPQNRPRIYILGRKISKFYTQVPCAPRQFSGQVRAADFLDLADNAQTPRLTELQAQCHAEWRKAFGQSMLDPRNRGKYAFVEGGRDPTPRTQWGTRASTRHPPIDRCQCLRASGPHIRVFALGEGQGELSLERNLRIRERAALQGFPAAIAGVQVSEKAGRRIFGNAMAVPVVGSVLAEELMCIQTAWGVKPGNSSDATAGPALPLQPPVGGPIQSIGPRTREFLKTWYPSDDEVDVMPGQRAAVVAQAGVISEHWDQGSPGRAPKRHCPLEPADHMALAWRGAGGLVPQAHPCGTCASAASASHTGTDAASSSELPSGSGVDRRTAPPEQGPRSPVGIPVATILPSDDEEYLAPAASQPSAPEGSDSDSPAHSETVFGGFF